MIAPRNHRPAAPRPWRGPAASRNPASRRARAGDERGCYQWDALDRVIEKDSSLATTARHTHGFSLVPGIGNVDVTKAVYNNETYFQYPLYDHRGSLYDLLDTGASDIDAEYTAFGEEIARTGDAPTRLGYQGTAWLRMPLPDGTALWVSPTRIYHGGLGRFLQKDPLYWMGAFEQDDPFVLSGKYFSIDAGSVEFLRNIRKTNVLVQRSAGTLPNALIIHPYARYYPPGGVDPTGEWFGFILKTATEMFNWGRALVRGEDYKPDLKGIGAAFLYDALGAGLGWALGALGGEAVGVAQNVILGAGKAFFTYGIAEVVEQGTGQEDLFAEPATGELAMLGGALGGLFEGLGGGDWLKETLFYGSFTENVATALVLGLPVPAMVGMVVGLKEVVDSLDRGKGRAGAGSRAGIIVRRDVEASQLVEGVLGLSAGQRGKAAQAPAAQKRALSPWPSPVAWCPAGRVPKSSTLRGIYQGGSRLQRA